MLDLTQHRSSEWAGPTLTSLMRTPFSPLVAFSSSFLSCLSSTALGRLCRQSLVRETKIFWSFSFWCFSSSNWKNKKLLTIQSPLEECRLTVLQKERTMTPSKTRHIEKRREITQPAAARWQHRERKDQQARRWACGIVMDGIRLNSKSALTGEVNWRNEIF